MDEDNKLINTDEGVFMTTEGTVTNIDAISDDEANSSHKLLHNGHLFILRDGKIFNAQGARVK